MKKGFILQPIDRINDWIFGNDNGLDKKELGNLSIYLPTTESQRFNSGDYWMCVPMAMCNAIETKFNYALKNNLISADNKKWLDNNGYIDEYGNINFDDWFVARNAGTKPGEGTSFKACASAIAGKYVGKGLIPQQKDPVPNDDFYSEVPQWMYDLGKEFLKRFQLNYEIVREYNFPEAIKYGPIVVGVSNWKYNGSYYVSNGSIIHAALLFDWTPNMCLDTYTPFFKLLEPTYNFMDYGYQWYVSEKISIISKIIDMLKKIFRDEHGGFWFIKDSKKQKIVDAFHGFAALVDELGAAGELTDEQLATYKDYKFFGK